MYRCESSLMDSDRKETSAFRIHGSALQHLVKLKKKKKVVDY